ncbi:MAG: hypothetical protein Q9207_008405, partial [Kuettlingeria erythrocarpa]
MLLQAGYDIHAQYTCLLFYRAKILPTLGHEPRAHGRPSQWNSYTTDDYSPIEYSWNWSESNKKPKIRFAIEAIGSEAGALVDPFNQSKSNELISTLATTQSSVSLHLFRHFWDTLLVSSKDAALIDERASPDSHRSSLFIACEMEDTGVMVKAYFMPMLRALETNQSRTHVTARAIRALKYSHEGYSYPALELLLDFMELDPLGLQTEVEMISVDCIDPIQSRIKVYLRHASTSWANIRKILTLNGRIEITESKLEELWLFYRSVLSLGPDVFKSTELPGAKHSTAGMFYCFYARTGDKNPTPKLSIPAKHYGRNDQAVTEGLVRYFSERGRGQLGHNYELVLRQISSHRPLESQCGIHTYIACQFVDEGLNVTSYLSPEIYHPARWAESPSQYGGNGYVFGRDFSASAR